MDELLIILEHQKKLLREILEYGKKQQTALIQYRAEETEQLARYQAELSATLRLTEEKRLKILMIKFQLSRRDAASMTLSQLEDLCQDEQRTILSASREELASLMKEIQKVNGMNRILANRARTGIQEILSLFTDGTVKVCNMRV